MWKINLWLHDGSTKTLTYDSYEEFSKGYWDVRNDKRVKIFEVPSTLEGF